MQHGCITARIFFMRVHERVNAVGRITQSKIVIEVILPKDAGIAFVRHDIGIGKQLVVGDGTPFIAQIVILHKCNSGLRLRLKDRIALY